MATQKPISTISYNSESFLHEKLETWYKAHIIQAYMYIKHKGEDGDKDHIHLRIEPNKKLDAMDLADELKEYVIGHDNPLGCRPFRPSKEEDWFLYALHDSDYMKIKYPDDKSEKLPYELSDIVVSEGYDSEVAYIRAKANLKHTSANVAKRIMSGDNPINLIQEGENAFVVNALHRAIYSSDYSRLAKEFDDLNLRYNLLLDAINSYGLSVVCDKDGKLKLE